MKIGQYQGVSNPMSKLTDTRIMKKNEEVIYRLFVVTISSGTKIRVANMKIPYSTYI